MSATRLLLLGTVRIFQPVHGYLVRRELLSWHADSWAHVNPGSVYNGLRSLARDGFVAEVGTEAEGGRPARTTYRLTDDGEAEFMMLVRSMLWNISPHDPANLMAAWSFTWALKREEVIAALEHRIEQIAGSARASEFAIENILSSAGTPDTVVEHFHLTQALMNGEARWAGELIERLRGGAYWFQGEPNRPWDVPAPLGEGPEASEAPQASEAPEVSDATDPSKRT